MQSNVQKFPSGEVREFAAADPVKLPDGSVDPEAPVPVWGLIAYTRATGDKRAVPALGTSIDDMRAPFEPV
tara:strand:- start:3203 stop:3415 length:213 start_codon:yes stop_codon:yes gene_type:complete